MREGWAEGRVVLAEPMGNETLLTAESGGQRVVARAAADVDLAAGAAVWFSVDPARVLLFGPDGARVPGHP